MTSEPTRPGLSRRDMLRRTGLGLLGASLAGQVGAAPAAPAPAAAPAPVPAPSHNRFPRIVQEYYVARIRETERQADLRRAAVGTRAEAEAYVQEVRRKIGQCFGPPPEKTPLQARITGVLERDAYRIEKVIFESRPGFLVTANLYVPKGRSAPMPGVVAACGHYPEAKAAAAYQSFAQALARFGYVTLIFDPAGQGERLQYPDESLRSRKGDNGVREHLFAGNQQLLVGESLPAWRAWDGIRALDYLLSRPEVDPAHVGITGNSGGGTDTTWLCGWESRWTMAAPQCFVTTFRRNLENELPADSEQCPPRALALGLDHSDFIAAMAPKPVVLLGQEKDFFDARGLEEAYARLRRLYALLGAEQNIRLVIDSDYHAFSQPSREAMYGWFNRVTGLAPDGREPALTLETEADLRCTPRGQVSTLGSRTIFSFTREHSLALRRARPVLAGGALRAAVAAALRLPPVPAAPEYRILRPARGPAYAGRHAAVYAVETEPHICALVYRLSAQPLISRPPRRGGRALLYVCHRSSDEELQHDPWLAALAQSEEAVFTCDPRGIGESRPNTCGRAYDEPYSSDYFYAAHGVMFDHPYVGQKTFDVLAVLAFLANCGHTEVHLAAAGWGTIPATFAAVLSDQVTQVSLLHAPTSFGDIAESEEYNWPLSTFVPGVLRTFDLPDCYAALAGKNLRRDEPWGPGADA
ncbi:MAG: acetylxylan esterase [Opitutaceae bacterium]|nr:acetylxylan esterase [Opitutaceae bacterium]